ncbi:hypothetical protein UFOVP124_51 [uncultured Caudovirales phage]|uniref:Uncharacterized protein n=1 Tax=uncultured Caudovirales phage TaxID=2100421 RepID=A0A6J5L950_9CAUD|nr:hypothetical protein UFOVP124_51 [uncultured Caudovirales phage]
MAFSQATITDVLVLPIPSLALVRVTWASTSTSGTTFQVYANGQLAWHGTDTQAEFAWPAVATTYIVGTVGDGEGTVDFSAFLTGTQPLGKARLDWHGGRYLDPLLTAFKIYGESLPGTGISYTAPIATVPAQIGPNPLDGTGEGGFGGGGFGYADQLYSWTSPVLPVSGTWNFAITAINAAGNESTVATVAVNVIRPPDPPKPDANGKRLTYTYSQSTHKVTLNWNENS